MLRFTEDHMWVKVEMGKATIGITSYAAQELGEIVHVSLPHIGKCIEAGKECMILESTKAAVDLYAPLSGTVVAVHSSPQLITLLNHDAEKEGWLLQISIDFPEQLKKLLEQEAYRSLTVS